MTPDAKQFYVVIKGQPRGPFSPAELLKAGLRPETSVWREGMADWGPADQVPELQAVFAAAAQRPAGQSGVGKGPPPIPGKSPPGAPPTAPTAATPTPSPPAGTAAVHSAPSTPAGHQAPAGHAAAAAHPSAPGYATPPGYAYPAGHAPQAAHPVQAGYPPQAGYYPPQGAIAAYPAQAYPPAGAAYGYAAPVDPNPFAAPGGGPPMGERQALPAGFPKYTKASFQALRAWYLSLFLGQIALVMLAVLLVVVGSLAAGPRNDDLFLSLGAIVAGLAILLGLPTLIVMMLILYRGWDLIQDGQARTTPGMAVGLLFVPFFNLYWIFVAWAGLAVDMNRFARRYRLGSQIAPEGLATTVCVCTLLSLIPVLGLIPALLCSVLAPMTIAKLATAAGRLAAAK